MDKSKSVLVMFCLTIFATTGRNADAAPAEYYKAGNVGVFAVNVEIPADITIGTVRFTAQASNEKVYLLCVRYPESVTKRWRSARDPSHRPAPTPEQEAGQAEINQQIDGLNEKRRKVSGRLRFKIKRLRTIKEEAEKDHDEALLEGTQAKIKSLETEVAELRARRDDLDEQVRVLRQEQRDLLTRPRRLADQQEDLGAIGAMRVLGRFQGEGKVKVTVSGRDPSKLLAKSSALGSVELDLPSENGGNADLLKQWATAQAGRYRSGVMHSPYTSYYQYWLLQSQEKYGVPEHFLWPLFRERDEREEGPDLYAMTTGALAIQESLQLEEMTGRREIPSDRGVPIESLKGPSIKSHPFHEMLQGRTPKIFPVAALVPYDNYYCHFTSISKEIAASDLVKQWGTSLLRSLTVSARDSDVPSRYTDQLCIDISELTRLFGDFVIGEIAITGGDPFLRVGSDMAVIIEVKNRGIFDAMMKSYKGKMLKANSDAKESKGSYEGVPIRSVVTPDRRISSHSCYLGNYKVYSNSLDTLQLIINTHGKKGKSMAENLDFQYMRTIFPGTAEAEDGFIYMSDSFIRKLLSARWKIEGQRRIICVNHLRMIANAATMYRMEMRKGVSIKTLIEEKYLSEKATRCPDGGTYTLDESGRGFCSIHNCLQYCTAISSVGLNGAAGAEAEDYRRFVERYNSYWSRFFDPIGIRLRLGNRIEVETCILPLIENSMYNQLREVIGGEPVQLDSQILTDRTVASIASKLKLRIDSSMLEDILEIHSPFLHVWPKLEECVGDNLSLNFYDSDVLFTFSEESMRVFGGWMDFEEQLIVGLIGSSINLPIYAVVDIKDEAQTKILIRKILGVTRQRWEMERRSMSSWLGLEPYSWGEYKGHEINTVALRLFVVKLRLHYTIASGRLIVSTKRYVLESVLDSLERMRKGGGTGAKANLQLNIRPRAVDRLRPIVRLGWQERMRNACLKNLEPVRVLIECHGASERSLQQVSKKIEGVTLRCPSGGAYKHDSEREIVYCTVHGNHSDPRQPVEVKENEGLLDFISRLTDLSVRFRFTD
jgi:hypothetical protein